MIGCDFSVIVNGLSLGGGLGKMIGSDFSVIVNGLNLGGAIRKHSLTNLSHTQKLGLLFGFFASTDERLTRISPVKIFTYGMPLMATNSFADAFRHQEMSRKVQHARFYNHNDVGEYILIPDEYPPIKPVHHIHIFVFSS